ncbi:MAG: response regulator [Deltaproteobacteria bacterium]|nr:response regulator [Deltaproteobacteria bacterium]
MSWKVDAEHPAVLLHSPIPGQTIAVGDPEQTPEVTRPTELYVDEPVDVATDDIHTEPLGRVLVVDDSAGIRKQLTLVLGELPAVIDTAASGPECLSIAEQTELALVVLDLGMPGMDGFATAERLRAMPLHTRTPIVFMTGSMNDGRAAFRGYELGAVDFLFKPIDPVVLQSKARVFIELFDHRRKLEAVVSEIGDADDLSHLVQDLESERRRRRMLAERLWRSERRLRAVVQSNADGLLVVDPQGSVLFLNGSAARMLGRHPVEAVGQLFFLPEKDGDLLELQIGGEIRKIEVRVSDIEWSLGERAVLAALRDVTDREKLAAERRIIEAQLLQSHKLEAIGQLAAGIAHEINTPTQYIGSNLEFLDRAVQKLVQITESVQRATQSGVSHESLGALQAELKSAKLGFLVQEIPRAVKEARDGIEQVSTIVRSMKEFSHPGSGSKESTDLVKIVESALVVSRNEWKYVADVNTEIEPDLPQVECLGIEIKQVVLNLIVNASHAIASRTSGDKELRGHIEVGMRVVGDFVEISVRDDGTGIPVDILSRIFEPFFTTKEVGRGTGQGLAIVYAVVARRHNGYLRVGSDVGVGTRFVVGLPIKADGPAYSGLALSFTNLAGEAHPPSTLSPNGRETIP